MLQLYFDRELVVYPKSPPAQHRYVIKNRPKRGGERHRDVGSPRAERQWRIVPERF